MDLDPTPREYAGAHILRQYLDAGHAFDGIDQMLLPHLREHRRASPLPADYRPLEADLSDLGFDVWPRPRPNLAVDATVLLSYARLDNPTVGAALLDAMADVTCRLLVSPLSYLETAPTLAATPGGDERLRRLLHNAYFPGALITPPVELRHLEIIARLQSGEPLAVIHTALLALDNRCVIGTLDPAPYHRLGYRRTLDLSA
jgi:hypothetical protein